jgi:UDP-glucose 4-epimerase
MSADTAPLDVLYLGGTGTISASCVRLSAAAGMRVTVVNRGRNRQERALPGEVQTLVADVADETARATAIGDSTIDAVVNIIS